MTLLENSKKVYNSYLLLHKLNELKVNNGESLQSVISRAIRENKNQVQFNLQDKPYTVNIEKKDSGYKLKLSGIYNEPEVKDVLKYTNEDIIALWANSEVSLDKGESNSYAFAIDITDETRNQNLKIGGPGKKVPFSLRFYNFYEVIKILQNEPMKPLQEKLRLANNIATGSGKTGDIAFLKLACYLSGIPCITIVPTDTLRIQANQFDKEFLPDEVAAKFAVSLLNEERKIKNIEYEDDNDLQAKIKNFKENNQNIKIIDEKTLKIFNIQKDIEEPTYIITFDECKHNTEYVTATFDEALNSNWNALKDKYSKNNEALICIDEAPKLKENAVLVARAVELASNNPAAYFSATPDAFLAEKFKIQNQILLSPKERSELGIGKLPIVGYSKVEYEDFMHRSQYSGIASYKDKCRYGTLPEEAYIKRTINTHTKLAECKNVVQKFNTEKKKAKDLSQLFLDCISKSIDSPLYKVGLIASEQKYNKVIIEAIHKSYDKAREELTTSFLKAIKELNLDLKDDEIKKLIKENLNIGSISDILPSIKLHNIIDTLNEYKNSGKEVSQSEVSEFIEKKYDITGSFNDKLTESLITLNTYSIDNKQSIERNYTGDKKLHEDIFKNYSQIKDFCNEDLIISQFNNEIYTYNSRKESQYILNDKEILQMIKAGFVPVTISKDLAIGIDVPRLDKAAAIINGHSDLLNPMFLMQLMGRVGRDASRSGMCYFDTFTSNESYLNLKNITDLSGGQLLTRLTEDSQKYLKDEEGFINAKAALLNYDIRINCIFNFHNNRHNEDVRATLFGGASSYLEVMRNRIKKELESINVVFGYDKEIFIKLSTEILKSLNKKLNDVLKLSPVQRASQLGMTIFENSSDEIKDLKKFINDVDDYIKTLNSRKANNSNIDFSPDMTLKDLAQYIVNAKPMTNDELVNANPESSAPIFMEQKHISASAANQYSTKAKSNKSSHPNLPTGSTNTPNSIPQVQNNKVNGQPKIPTQQHSSKNNHFKIKEKFPYAALIASLASITCFCCSLPMLGVFCAMLGALYLFCYGVVNVAECVAPAVCKAYNFLKPNSKLEESTLEQNTSSESLILIGN